MVFKKIIITVTAEKNILVLAGEASGDLHGAALIKAMKAIDPSLSFYGIGGDEMKSEGMQLLYHINKMAFLGFVEVIKHLPFIKKVQTDVLKLVEEKNIQTCVLIDYPGFNLSIAKKLNVMERKIIYYISPQIWAWGKHRIHKIKKLVNKMLVLFPFEETFYKKAGVDATFVGHPLIERINNYSFVERNEFFSQNNLDVQKDILLVLPGSRIQEVAKIFPSVIEGAVAVAKKFNLQVVVGCSSNIDEKTFKKLSREKDYLVIKNKSYELFKYAKLGIIKSGTSTLEAALFGLPMVIVYRTNALTYFIGKKLVTLRSIGLANIIAGETVVPELIQNAVNTKNILNECSNFLSDVSFYKSVSEKLKSLKDVLGNKHASKTAAEIIIASINEV
ncbi:MAG: lipid-A-disaccharide synthase [Ignavibacteria bacterium CG_4_9_14_0_2_um_filter_37_13]|nr:MAG: lipid-A-disaccharide synthase [Ignavibacteria bacterium CG_4_9_14_0_2_um_filter_37_13]